MQRTPPAKLNHVFVSKYLKAEPATTPQEAMDARQQAHINELTEKLRTAEHTCKKLREELTQVQAQMKAERVGLYDQRLTEAQAWKTGTELTRVSYQASQARLLLLLDMERRNVLSGEDAVRREKVAKIQRDYRLALFQQKESDLELRVIDLQETLEAEREERERGDQEYEELREKHAEVIEKYGKLKGKYSTLLAKSAEVYRELERSGTKRGEVEDDVSRLEEEVKNLKAASDTLKSSLKRETLRFEGIKNEKDELENANAELKRSNADLKRQVDKWQSLENKEGTETEKLRKERIALEVKLRELEARLSEKEQHLAEEIEVKEAKIGKFRARLQDYVIADKESREFIAQLEGTCEGLRQTVATLREQNVKLKAEISTAEQEIKIFNTVERKHRSKPVTTPDMDLTAEEEEPPRPPSPKPKAAKKTKSDVEGGPSKPPRSKKAALPPEPETESGEVHEAPRPKSRPKPVKKQPSTGVSELSEDGPKRGRGKKQTEEDMEKPRPKPKPKKKAQVHEVTEDSDVGVEPGPSKPRGRGKAKSTAPQESVSVAPKKRGRPKATTDEEDQPPKKKSATKKAAGRQSATSQQRDEEDDAEEEAKVKKKRKLRIFGSSQPTTFVWKIDTDKVANGLDIPTELSPMKEGEPCAIPRSIFSTRTSSSFVR